MLTVPGIDQTRDGISVLLRMNAVDKQDGVPYICYGFTDSSLLKRVCVEVGLNVTR